MYQKKSEKIEKKIIKPQHFFQETFRAASAFYAALTAKLLLAACAWVRFEVLFQLPPDSPLDVDTEVCAHELLSRMYLHGLHGISINATYDSNKKRFYQQFKF